MAFIWHSISSFWYTLLSSLGLSSIRNKSGSLIVLGLDNAGKTTLLYRLRTGGCDITTGTSNEGTEDDTMNSIRQFPPTDRPSIQTFTISTGYTTSIEFNAWDLGGHEAVRHLWDDYIIQQDNNSTNTSKATTGIIFVIDANDTERLEEAAYELDSLICDPNKNHTIQNVPILVLFNKCDLASAMSSEEICTRIEWHRLCLEHEKNCIQSDSNDNDKHINKTQQEQQLLNCYRISAFQGTGYQEAFQWISKYM